MFLEELNTVFNLGKNSSDFVNIINHTKTNAPIKNREYNPEYLSSATEYINSKIDIDLEKKVKYFKIKVDTESTVHTPDTC